MTLVQADSRTQEENDRVRVTRWHLPPGSQTGPHVHAHDYVVVPLVTGTLTILDDDGVASTAPLKPGGSYFRRAGVSHNVTNQSDSDIVFIEIELLQAG